MQLTRSRTSERIVYSISLTILLAGACVDVFDIAQGTGQWRFGFSFTWALLFGAYVMLTGLGIFTGLSTIWNDVRLAQIRDGLLSLRGRMGQLRWLMAVLAWVAPIYLLQFTALGIILQGLFIRLLIGCASLLMVSYFISSQGESIQWRRFLFVIVWMGGSFAIAAALRYVSGYPFSQGWSEGNRLWDYSILFGRDRYLYPSNEEIPVALDKGRQFVGGLPFLIPGVTIEIMRFWVGVTGIFPYLLIGAVLFRFSSNGKWSYFALIVWAYLFLNQGPIHPPLILSAVIVFFAWRSRSWLALLLVLISSYFASVSRFTWAFAPVMWLLMLELSDVFHQYGIRVPVQKWGHIATLTLAGLFGGVVLPPLLESFSLAGVAAEQVLAESPIAPQNVAARVSRQPFLWYRLLPNETYPPGILLGLLLAVGPSLAIILFLGLQKRWKVNPWQVLLLTVCLLAFLVMGIIVSAKIGGGGDLHNMDMFLIGILLTGAMAWYQGGREWLADIPQAGLTARIVLVFALIIPAIKPLSEMRGYGFSQNTSWLMALTDAPNERALDMYPSRQSIDSALELIQREASISLKHGEVLFMDQRQLLTFGKINGIPLVPDYDKKLLIERSFSQDHTYFKLFYSELAEERFSLIIVQPLTTSKKGFNDQFGEENNSWVKWVARPLLCYYEAKHTLTDVNVQLLVPKKGKQNCEAELP